MHSAVEFLREIKKNERVCVVLHNDGDGICSGAIILLLLEEKGLNAEPMIIGRLTNLDMLEEYDKVIMVDVSPDELENNTEKVLIIDHHKRKRRPACIFVNPAFEQDKVPSASALCYKLYSLAGGKRNIKWLGLLGAYSDRMLSASLPLLSMNDSEMNTFLPAGQLDPALTGVTLAFLAGYLKQDMGYAVLDLVLESAKREDPMYLWLEKDRKAKEIYQTIELANKEARSKIINSKLFVDESKRFVYLDLGSAEYKIKRIVVDYIRLKYPDYVVSVSMDVNEVTTFSNRSPDRDLSVVIPKAIEGFPASRHGGHVRAYGCSVQKVDKKRFVRSLLNAL